ncbi:MAG: hypothetical protein QM793_15150 [Muricomes sp.]
MKKKRKRQSLCYLNPAYVSREVRRFGYSFSVRKYIGYFAGLYGCVACLALVFKLKLPFIVAACGITACFLPGLFVMVHRSLYEEKRFEEITAYMEQVLYSFKRHAKILNSLEDTLVLFESEENRLFDAISEAISYIQAGESERNLYREAFSFIEKEYGCPRLYKIHDFLIESEMVGGDFTLSADILLKDRRLWIDRVYELQREKKNIKVKITIGIGLSFLVCGMTVYMLPEEFGITGQLVSQIVTTATLLLNLLIWYTAQMKLSKSLIQDEQKKEYKEVQRQYVYVMHGELSKEKRKMYAAAFLLLPAVLWFGWKSSLTAAGLLILFSVLLITQPERRYKVSLKHVTREIEKAFPDWMMSMSLHLQTDNVHVSLAKSISHAPEILQEELNNLLERIEDRPDSIQPYLSFMNRIPLPDITSSMKVLYSMAEFGVSDISNQIGPLVERSTVMTDKAERLKAEDYLAGIGFFVLLPMITGVMKMLADLALVMVYILSTVKNI